jgi:hypothetical protein
MVKPTKFVDRDNWNIIKWQQRPSQITGSLLHRLTLKNQRNNRIGYLNIDASMKNYESWKPVIEIKISREDYHLTNLTIENETNSKIIFDGDSDYQLIKKSSGGMGLFDFGE